MNYYLGTSGYSYQHWKQRFYPKDLPQNEWLEYYAKYFLTVEINSSFYRFPYPNVLKAWYNKTPKDFLITLKANRSITHIKRLRNVKRLLNNFYSLADLLKEKLGCILFQLPPNFKIDTKILKNFLEMLPNKYENVVEFRNNSWFCNEVYELLKQYNIIFCIVNSPSISTRFIKTSNTSYIRFHGLKSLYSSNYSDKELKDYAEKIKNLKAKKVYAYFNNDFNTYAVKNCLKLKSLLK